MRAFRAAGLNPPTSKAWKPVHSREHHFVPQFYLRSFSKDGKSINCFNFARGSAIAKASIKHQCSRHNFHAFLPPLEQLLGDLEQEAAAAIRALVCKRELPAPDSMEALWLLRFVVFQKLRTAKAARKSDSIREYIEESGLRAALAPNPPGTEDPPPIAIPLSLANEMVPVAADLRMHLFCNDTPVEFITSDDPVMVHNQYCEGIHDRGVNGWNCAGLQVFLPVSPNETLFLFDAAVYKVGLAHKGVATSLLKPSDVRQLNALQALNADQNVYFASPDQRGEVTRECARLTPRRPKSRYTYIETEAVQHVDGTSSALLHSFERLLPARLSISAISIRKKAKQVSLYDRASLYRNARQPAVEAMPRQFRADDGATVRYAVRKISEL